ncbi:MAG: serine/threonine protein kinase, partial [Sphaerospermopsis kisseleviana]
ITNSTIAKPAGSQIRLIKNEEYLKTTLPPEGLTLNNFLEIIVMILWNSLASLFIVGAFIDSIRSGISHVLFLSPFLFAGLCWWIHGIYCILSSFSECKISINQQQISYGLYLWGMKIKHTSAPRENINHLVYIPQHLKKDSETGESVVNAKLVIWIGVEKLEIKVGDYIIKSEYELKWLAH